MLGEVVARPGALVDLRLRLAQQLAHLLRHEDRELRFSLSESCREASQEIRAVGERGRAPLPVSLDRSVEDTTDGIVGELVELPDERSVERIDALEYHAFIVLPHRGAGKRTVPRKPVLAHGALVRYK